MLRIVRLVGGKIEEQRLLAGVCLDESDDVVGIALGVRAAVEMLVEILVQRVRIISELAAADRGVPGGLDRLCQRGAWCGWRADNSARSESSYGWGCKRRRCST